jgi:hypothetical protein
LLALLARLRTENLQQDLLHDQGLIFRRAKMEPDPWQAEALAGVAARECWVCSRQIGKSETAAALALKTAVVDAPALVLIVSPSLRQSLELFRKITRFYNALMLGREEKPEGWRPQSARKMRARELEWASGDDLVQESKLSLEMASGSRILALPGKEATVRSFSAVKLLILDEAARIPDDLYNAVRPMLAVSQGRLVALSSAWAKQGWFYEAASGKGDWRRVKKTALECPRLSPEFLAAELEDIGHRWFQMEYMAEFSDPVDAVFLESDVQAAMREAYQPIFRD